ncbi:MAG: CsgG/HfaB family protein [Spirochaetaceae bacterium]|jgi:TolB-like protein|nr:CsgG/HfaB family protein [Spirochaetaceae bacterium]
MKKFLCGAGATALSAVLSLVMLSGCAGLKTWLEQDDLTDALRAGSDELNRKIAQGSKAAFLNFTSKSPELSEYIIEELINNSVTDGVFTVVDRQNLAAIQQEMDFQLSGDVSDASAQSIGQKLGAQVIVSGSIVLVGTNYSLRLRAISVETAAIVATYSKNISYSALIRKLGGEAMAPAAVYPASLVGSYYVDAADGKTVTLEFTRSDALELLGSLTCVYSYSGTSGKGNIFDPASSARKIWGTFSLTTATGSMMTLVLDGKDVPMRLADKPAARGAGKAPAAAPAPARQERERPAARDQASSRPQNSEATLASISVQGKTLNINPAGGSVTSSPSTANGAPKTPRPMWNAMPLVVALNSASAGAAISYFVDKDANWDASPAYKSLTADRTTNIDLSAVSFGSNARVCIRVVSEDGKKTRYYRFEVGP